MDYELEFGVIGAGNPHIAAASPICCNLSPTLKLRRPREG